MRTKTALLLAITLGFASCEKETINPHQNTFDGTMSDIVVPDGFEFSMTQLVDIDLANKAYGSEVATLKIYRTQPTLGGAPIWSAHYNESYPERNQVVLRKTDQYVFAEAVFNNGQHALITVPVYNQSVVLDFASFSNFAGKTTSCTDSLTNGGGFGTRIDSVVDNGGDYTITFTVFHNGCGGPSCKELSHFSVEVDPANSFSNVTWTPNNGGISGTIENSLGNNDPFDGFKLDNVSGIGGGNAGSFTMSYTITNLQDQQFLAKAGNNYTQIAAFTVADFQCIEARTGSNTGGGGGNSGGGGGNSGGGGGGTPVVDTDGDGVPDSSDDFPNDPNLSSVFTSDTMSFAAEDNWPYAGDFDFNDLVLPYFYKAYINGNNELVEFKFYYKILARGAAKENGFGFSLTVDPALAASVTGYRHTEGYISLDPNGAESGSNSELCIIPEDLVHNKMPSFNTIPGIQRNPDHYDSVMVSFNAGVPAAVHLSHNPFLITDKSRGLEIHEIDHTPTFKANMNVLGSGLDASNPATGAYYRQSNGLPWVLNVPGEFKYPFEQVDITEAYMNFVTWAESGGTQNVDWYDNDVPANIDASKIYPY